MRVIAVIPARAGSKGIPRKNMRLMAGRPLIEFAIRNAVGCPLIDDVVVTTDSAEILSFVQQLENVKTVKRDPKLSDDVTTLDPVVLDAVDQMENLTGVKYDLVVTLQPTSPLLSGTTLQHALETFIVSDHDSLLSVVNRPHLSWGLSEKDQVVPLYEERRNRQQLSPHYMETGAFVISRREAVSASSRLGEKISVYEVPDDESIDIDTTSDWILCESLLSKKKIVYRVDGHKDLGLGHIYRGLTIAYALTEHDISFVCRRDAVEGIAKLRASHMKVIEVDDDEDFFEWLSGSQADIVINDCLDSSVNYIQKLKHLANRVVTIEDLGAGAVLADAVINALYEGDTSGQTNVFSGQKYVCLRDEFLLSAPSDFNQAVERCLVMFGGTDPLNLTSRIFSLAERYNGGRAKVRFDFLLGPGYRNENLTSMPSLGIHVHTGVDRVTDFMKLADIAISSQGRTTFELASMAVPTIILPQNEREQLHTFAQMDNGFINLGLGSEVSDEDIASTFKWLCSAPSIRREMHAIMLRNDFTQGVKRVRSIVLGDI